LQPSRKGDENPHPCFRIMRRLLLATTASALLIAPAMAEPPAAEGNRDFATFKQRRLARIDAMRACVAKATNFGEMRACKPERKAKPGA